MPRDLPPRFFSPPSGVQRHDVTASQHLKSSRQITCTDKVAARPRKDKPRARGRPLPHPAAPASCGRAPPQRSAPCPAGAGPDPAVRRGPPSDPTPARPLPPADGGSRSRGGPGEGAAKFLMMVADRPPTAPPRGQFQTLRRLTARALTAQPSARGRAERGEEGKGGGGRKKKGRTKANAGARGAARTPTAPGGWGRAEPRPALPRAGRQGPGPSGRAPPAGLPSPPGIAMAVCNPAWRRGSAASSPAKRPEVNSERPPRRTPGRTGERGRKRKTTPHTLTRRPEPGTRSSSAPRPRLPPPAPALRLPFFWA